MLTHTSNTLNLQAITHSGCWRGRLGGGKSISGCGWCCCSGHSWDCWGEALSELDCEAKNTLDSNARSSSAGVCVVGVGSGIDEHALGPMSTMSKAIGYVTGFKGGEDGGDAFCLMHGDSSLRFFLTTNTSESVETLDLRFFTGDIRCVTTIPSGSRFRF